MPVRTKYRYGPAAKNSDSAINILLDVVKDQSGKTYRMDHWAHRYPTNVGDIANFLVRFSGLCSLSFVCLPTQGALTVLHTPTFIFSCLT